MGKAGRPKQYRNAADRQKAYRERLKLEKQRRDRLEALRNSPGIDLYKWFRFDVVFPGTCCVYCGYQVEWPDEDGYQWSIRFSRYRYIPPVRQEGWMESPDANASVCPQCVIGRTKAELSRDFEIFRLQGKSISPRIDYWGNRDEAYRLALLAPIKSME